ncbi:MAG TPA: FHA domain-containing protein [Thermodesulfobacteriota bacterium]
MDHTHVKGRRPEPFGAPFVVALAVVDGPDLTAIHRITQTETIVGRGTEADFSLTDPSVSKRHVAVRVEGGVYTLVDLESLNGTVLNDRRLGKGARERLKNLDEIRVGDTRLLFIAARYRTEA